MRFRTIGIWLLLSFISPFALPQNLVPNPSFECGPDPCDFILFPSDFGNRYVCNWNCPTNGTSDIFSTLIPNKNCYAAMPPGAGDFSPLNPHIGSQFPRTGNRFAGIFTFTRIPPGSVEIPNYREYLQVPLTVPLVTGEYYCAEMYVSLAERPKFAANNLGMYFHDMEIHMFPFNVNLPFVPQVIEKEIIQDNVNWVKVSGTFKATSAARFLTIGNFFNDNQTSFIDKGGTHPEAYGYFMAYYFVDDVSVQKVVPKSFVFSGNTTICENETAVIEVSTDLESITWMTLNDTLKVIAKGKVLEVHPSVTTRYIVKGKNCTLIVKDTVTVQVKPIPHFKLINDTTICKGSTVTLDAGAGFKEYRWRDNSVSQRLNVSQAGVYSVQVKNQFGCLNSDEVKISVIDIPLIDLGLDTLVCASFYPLQIGGSKQTYQWSSGSTDSVFTPTEAGTYWVTVKNQCGQALDSISIDSFKDVFIPNVLTLNNDGLNERFEIPNQRGGLRLKVYNRWGKEIFERNGYENDWPQDPDGLPPEVYYYSLSYANCSNRKGWIQIIK